MRPRRVAFLAAMLSLLLVASAWAAVGGLTQKPGTDGCVSATGTAGACVDGTAIDGARSVAISPDGKSAYVAANFDDAVVIFDRNPATGVLTQKPGTAGCISETGSAGACLDGKGLDGAISVSISPDGASVYVVSFFGDAVAIFDRNTTTGALTQKPGTAGCISDTGTGGACVDGNQLDTTNGVTVSPDGTSVYVAVQFSGTGAVAIFDRNTTTGALTQKAGTAGCISQSGSAGACVDGNGLGGALSVAVSADGASVYVSAINSDSVAIFDRNPANGALTQKAGTAGCISETGTAGTCVDGKALVGADAVAVSPDGATTYVASATSDAIAIFDRNPATGALTQKAGTAGCISDTGTAGACVDGTALDGAAGVTVSPDDKSVYGTAIGGANALTIFDRNPATGALTQRAGTGGCISDDGSAGACVDGTALNGSAGVVVSPDEANVYVASQAAGAVSVFDRSTPPQTTIGSGPSGVTNDTTPTFTFSASEPGSSFQCRLDGEPFTACSGPGRAHTATGLTEGAHTFEVRAVDLTGDADETPASRPFSVDSAPPQTTIGSGPQSATADDTPTFTFASSEPAGAGFRCRLDNAPFASCSGPGASHTSPVLSDGPHTFDVRASDAAGNSDATSASRSFSVDTTAPVTAITKEPALTLRTRLERVKVKVPFSSASNADFECKLDGGEFRGCISPFAAKVASKSGKGKRHTIAIRAIDGLGNVEVEPATVSFRVIRKG